MSEFDIVIVGGGIAGASLGAEVAAKRRTLDHRGRGALRLSFDRSLGGILARALRRNADHSADHARHGRLARAAAGRPASASLLRQRGAIIDRQGATGICGTRLSVETGQAPRRNEIESGRARIVCAGLRAGWDFGLLDADLRRHRCGGTARAFLRAISSASGGVLMRSTALRSARARGRSAG